jgi:hypothetical protein
MVTFNFTGATPVAIATQAGSGAYTQATLAGGKVTISVPSGETNFSMAFLCPPANLNPSSSQETIAQGSTLDGTTFNAGCPASSTSLGLATLQVNAAAIPGASVVFAGNQGLIWTGSTLSFSEQLPAGTYDVPVSVFSQSAPNANPLAVRILRSQTIPGALNGAAPLVFGTSDETVPQTIAYNSVPNGFALNYVYISYQTAGGGSVVLNYGAQPAQYPAMPAAAVQSGDYYLFSAAANNAINGAGVGIEKATSSGGPQSFAFPAPWAYAGPTAAALPTFTYGYSGFSGMSNVSQFASIEWVSATGSNNAISFSASANSLNGSTSLTIPDLSSLTGFLAPPASGSTVTWFAELIQGGNPFATKTPNGTLQFVQDRGTYTTP